MRNMICARKYHIFYIVWLYMFAILCCGNAYAANGMRHTTDELEDRDRVLPVLIVSSYNPETFSISSNLRSLQSTLGKYNLPHRLIIENMNCKNFSEAKLWKERFYNMVSRFLNEENSLDLAAIVLLGQEAWSAYLSQDDSAIFNVPVVCGLISKNGLVLPGKDDSLATWNPDPIYVSNDKRDNIIAGYVYDYDIEANIKLARKFVPDFKNIALITDNTLGGVALMSHVVSEMKRHKDINLILLDGRKEDVYGIERQLSQLPDSTVLFIGTWRVDKKESYFISTSVYSMAYASRNLPAFSLSTVGLGHWAWAGCVPDYINQGEILGEDLCKILTGEISEPNVYLSTIPNVVKVDAQKLAELGLKEDFIKHAVLLNKELSFAEQHPSLFYAIIVIICGLLIITLLLLFYYYKIKRINKSLLISQNNNKLILDNIAVGLIFIDKNFVIRWENVSSNPDMPSYRNILLKSKDRPEKLSLKDISKDWPIEKIKETGLLESVIEKEGEQMFRTVYIPIFNDKGKYIGALIRINNVTELEMANIELKKAKETAETADKLKSLFLANMSHEIRTPLNAIVGFSELLADVDDPKEKQEFIRIIESNNRQLLQLINDILDLSKIEAGTLEFNNEQMSLSQVVEDVYYSFSTNCQAKGIELIKNIPEKELYLISDRSRIMQILSNFVVNAIKFTEQGSIEIGYNERDEDVKVYVKDTGCGIEEDKLQNIFERFVKLNMHIQGTGLGLSICKMIITRLNGAIGVDSKVGEGSTFWITIPKSNS